MRLCKESRNELKQVFIWRAVYAIILVVAFMCLDEYVINGPLIHSPFSCPNHPLCEKDVGKFTFAAKWNMIVPAIAGFAWSYHIAMNCLFVAIGITFLTAIAMLIASSISYINTGKFEILTPWI